MNDSEMTEVLLDIRDGVATLTINRPATLNALTTGMCATLVSLLDTVRDDPAVRVVIITGAGDRAFVAGADIRQLREHDIHSGLQADYQRAFDVIEDFPKPTIAAVNGLALGGGCELAMACDIRVAAGTAQFGQPETNLAVLPGAGGTQRLTRLVGTGRALDLILTGRSIDAETAEQWGLVTHVVEAPGLLDRAHDIAQQLLTKGPAALQLAKLVVRAGADTDQRTGQVIERLAQSVLYTTQDKAEGTQAFLDKRSPAFHGT